MDDRMIDYNLEIAKIEKAIKVIVDDLDVDPVVVAKHLTDVIWHGIPQHHLNKAESAEFRQRLAARMLGYITASNMQPA